MLILNYAVASAQQHTINGTITDDTGKPVPFASILIRNTTRDKSTNGDGVCSINVAAGNYELLFKDIGFQQENDVIVRGKGEGPAYGIISNVIRKRKTYLNEINTYNADVYLKGRSPIAKKRILLNLQNTGKYRKIIKSPYYKKDCCRVV